MLTTFQMKQFVNRLIHQTLTKEAAALKLDHLDINARQKDVTKMQAYLLAIAEDFKQKELTLIERQNLKRAKKNAAAEVPPQGVQEHPQE